MPPYFLYTPVMRKTTMYFRPEDDAKMEEIKSVIQNDDQTAVVRYALHNCTLPRKYPKKR